MNSEVLLIGGRSGAGKTSVGLELHAILSSAAVAHCVIDGDYLDMAYPPPTAHSLAEQNLAAVWGNYRALGYRRLIYLNSASVLPDEISTLTAAMGDQPRIVPILLTCTDATAVDRLMRRETKTALTQHIQSSSKMDVLLRRAAPDAVRRIATDDRTVHEIAVEIAAVTGWLSSNR